MAAVMEGLEVDITTKFHGVLTEELSPLQSTLMETNRSMAGLSTRFVEMESLLTNLCRTVDILQGQVKVPIIINLRA